MRPFRFLSLLALHALAVLGLSLASPAAARAGDPAVPGEILLKLSTADALPALLSKYSLTLAARFGARPIFKVQVIGAASVEKTLDALAAEPAVLIAERNFVHSSPEARRNLPWTIGAAGAYQAQWAPQALRLPQAQALASGRGVRVALLDTGIDFTHPALAGRLLPGRDFVDGDLDASEAGTPANPGFGHGTHVAGLVALVAPAAQIVPLRVLDADGDGNAWVLAEALLHAVDPDGNPATDDGAHVINMSLGSLSRTHLFKAVSLLVTCTPPDPGDAAVDFSDPGYDGDRQRCAASRGAVVTIAAGNDASTSVREYPAAESVYGTISVAASTAAYRIAAFSNSGNWIDLAAPGDGITSTVPGGYAVWSGTSMAAPLAAGVAALVREREPGLGSRATALRLVRSTAALCGTRLRQLDALTALTQTPAPAPACR